MKQGFAQLALVALTLILIASGLAVFLIAKNKTAPAPTRSSAETSVKAEDPTANWKTYTNTKFGFKLKYPNDPTLNAKEIDIAAQQRQYIEDCKTHEGCGGSRWPDYRIAFMRDATTAQFFVDIHVVPVALNLGGIEHENFTFQINTGNLIGQEPKADPMNEKVTVAIEKSLQFINPEKPLACLWYPEFTGLSDEYISENRNNPDYKFAKVSGFYYNRQNKSCQAVTINTWEDQKDDNNIPFSSQNACDLACK